MKQTEIGGHFLNPIKVIYEMVKYGEIFLWDQRMRKKLWVITTFTQHCTRDPSQHKKVKF